MDLKNHFHYLLMNWNPLSVQEIILTNFRIAQTKKEKKVGNTNRMTIQLDYRHFRN